MMIDRAMSLQFYEQAIQRLVSEAKRDGFNVELETVYSKPLAMGNTKQVVKVTERFVREQTQP